MSDVCSFGDVNNAEYYPVPPDSAQSPGMYGSFGVIPYEMRSGLFAGSYYSCDDISVKPYNLTGFPYSEHIGD